MNAKSIAKQYVDDLKNPKWQKKRLEIFNIKGFKCELCNSEDKQLHLHHRFYINGRKPWNYDNDVFQVLCEKCHEKAHSDDKSKIPGKYQKIISALKSINNFDTYNLLVILESDSIDANEFIRLLAFSITNGYADTLIDYMKDKETIEHLSMNVAILSKRLEEIQPTLQ